MEILGILSVVFVAHRLIFKFGNGVPIIELLLLIAGLQWIIGPIIDYNTETAHFKYYMYVEANEYLDFVVPAYCVFVLVLLFGVKNAKIDKLELEKIDSSKGYAILIIGISAFVLGQFLPTSLNFVTFLARQLLYCGALVLFFSPKKKSKVFFYGVLFFLFINSIQSALFHDFILWGAIFYMYWSIKNSKSIVVHIAVISVGLLLMTVIQNIKYEYRSNVWSNNVDNKFDLFIELAGNVNVFDVLQNDESQNELNVRLNQGWIISAIMDHMPVREEFAKGQTILEAIESSLLPRFLAPNKKQAGGQENFEKFTGLPIGKGTSMGISIMGEAYANFGRNGGIIFMGIWAFFLRRYWHWLMKKAKQNPVLLFMIPLIFLQVVKAETELVVVLNHLVKSTVLVFGLFYIMGWHKINKESEKSQLATTSTSQTR